MSRQDDLFTETKNLFELNGNLQPDAIYGAIAAIAQEHNYVLVGSANVGISAGISGTSIGLKYNTQGSTSANLTLGTGSIYGISFADSAYNHSMLPDVSLTYGLKSSFVYGDSSVTSNLSGDVVKLDFNFKTPFLGFKGGVQLELVDLICPFHTPENKMADQMLADMITGPFKGKKFKFHHTDPATGERKVMELGG